MQQHTNAYRLETDLMYRYNYVCKFVGFGADDIKTIKDCKDLIQPLVPKIVDEVYVKLFSFDITKAPFLKRNIGYQGKLAKVFYFEYTFYYPRRI